MKAEVLCLNRELHCNLQNSHTPFNCDVKCKVSSIKTCLTASPLRWATSKRLCFNWNWSHTHTEAMSRWPAGGESGRDLCCPRLNCHTHQGWARKNCSEGWLCNFIHWALSSWQRMETQGVEKSKGTPHHVVTNCLHTENSEFILTACL